MMNLAEVFGASPETKREQVQSVLQAIRRHLSMDVGFISEFVSGNRIFRFSDGDNLRNPIVVGASDPLEQSFCFYVARGLMPQLMHDAREDKRAAQMPVTHDLPVGAHLSVPLRHADGTPFGTLCCFSFTPDRSLTTRDLGLLRMCADVICAVLQKDRLADLDHRARLSRLSAIIERGAVDLDFDPVCRIVDGSLIGFDALPRLEPASGPSAEIWFAEAEALGLGDELALTVVEKTRVALDALDPAVDLILGFSPARVLSQAVAAAFRKLPLHRVVIEFTERVSIDSYEAVRSALAPARGQGLRIAIGDVGAGHSTFRHMLDLSPELIKLDRSLVRDIDTDSARRALAEALTGYSRRMGCDVVAAGVETAAQLTALREIGVTRAQGPVLGGPMPIAHASRVPRNTSLVETSGVQP